MAARGLCRIHATSFNSHLPIRDMFPCVSVAESNFNAAVIRPAKSAVSFLYRQLLRPDLYPVTQMTTSSQLKGKTKSVSITNSTEIVTHLNKLLKAHLCT